MDLSLNQMNKRFSLFDKKYFILFVIVGVLCLLLYYRTWAPLEFDPNKWKLARIEKDYKTCYRMAGSIVKKLDEQKPTESEAFAEIGEPDFQGNGNYYYYLGKGPIYWRSSKHVIFAVFDAPGRKLSAVGRASGFM